MSEKILVTTTGKDDVNQVIISDLEGSPIMNHPTINLDLVEFNTKDEILASAEFQNFVRNGILLAKDENGNSLLKEVNPLDNVGKEILLSTFQLEGANTSIKQATILTLLDLPIANDFITISNGTVEETYTFKDTAGDDFEVTIGVNPLASLTNLAGKINTHSELWKAKVETNWDIGNENNLALVIARKNQANSSYIDRVFGTLTTQEDCKYINCNNQVDYSKLTTSTLPDEDPEIKTFGMGRKKVDLTLAETHKVRNLDTALIYDNDRDLWLNLQGTRYAEKTITGDGTEDTFDIEHDLNCEFVDLAVWNNTTRAKLADADYTATKKSGETSKTVTLVFDTPPSNGVVYSVFVTAGTQIN